VQHRFFLRFHFLLEDVFSQKDISEDIHFVIRTLAGYFADTPNYLFRSVLICYYFILVSHLVMMQAGYQQLDAMCVLDLGKTPSIFHWIFGLTLQIDAAIDANPPFITFFVKVLLLKICVLGYKAIDFVRCWELFATLFWWFAVDLPQPSIGRWLKTIAWKSRRETNRCCLVLLLVKYQDWTNTCCVFRMQHATCCVFRMQLVFHRKAQNVSKNLYENEWFIIRRVHIS